MYGLHRDRTFRHFPGNVLQLVLPISKNILPSGYYPSNALRHTTHDIRKLLHVSTPRYHHQGVIRTEVYKPTCQNMLYTYAGWLVHLVVITPWWWQLGAETCRSLRMWSGLYYKVHCVDNILIVRICTVWRTFKKVLPISAVLSAPEDRYWWQRQHMRR